jgi:hypothetical protein
MHGNARLLRGLATIIGFSGLILAAAVSAVTEIPAWADETPACTPPDGVTSLPLQSAPPPLLRALRERIGELAPPGAPFDATDVVTTGRNRRLIFVWHSGARWIIATEHGGIGYNDPIFAYDLSQDNRNATFVQERTAIPNTVCATAISLLR